MKRQPIRAYFVRTDQDATDGIGRYRLLLLTHDTSCRFHKLLASTLKVDVMAFGGGEIVSYRRTSRLATPLYGHVNWLVGRLTVPDWFYVGHLREAA